MKRRTHNAHMLIPEDLWRKVERQAEAEGISKTRVVSRALARYLKRKAKERAQ